MEPAPSKPPELDALARASAALGTDRRIVQAAGGNTSVKVDDTLWVKASGFWLEQALARPIFVPLRLSGVRRRIRAGEPEPARPEVLAADGVEGLRPSIETSLHALLPQRWVLHTHSVATIAWAVRSDAQEVLGAPLAGLRWAWIPYVMPGLPLTKAVAGALEAAGELDVLVLGNHGLVVAAHDLDDALALHATVEARLARPLHPVPPYDRTALAAVAARTGRRIPDEPLVHLVATDPAAATFALAGPAWPDHVIFLGPRLSVWADGAESEPDAALLVVPGTGVLYRRDLSRSGEELAICLALVAQRLTRDVATTTLPEAEIDALLRWDAEAYRRELERRTGR
jgi:rhamnose utilization protein RhaD (predicted bifunctional aldolase and dehydrogenase)